MDIRVVILNWNGKKDTLACLASLSPSKNIIVVDNGSCDDSVKAIQEKFPGITLIETKENLGYAGGNNVGIEYALTQGAEWVLLLNNDTIVAPSFLDALKQAIVAQPDVDIFGAWPLRFYDDAKLDHLGGIWNPQKGAFDLIGLNASKDFQYDGPLDYVCGCSILIRKEVFQKIGTLEKAFFLFWEEADFCMRAKKNGFKLAICRNAILRHKVSASFTGGKPNIAYFWWRNRLLWMERNLSAKERRSVTWKTVLPEIFHLHKLRLLKGLQLFFLQFFKSEDALKSKRQKMLQYRASLQGVRDFRCRKFGNFS